jgi:hypothetical protein
MPPKHGQPRAPRPKASGNAFQALVDPPNDGNNLSLDGGDGKGDGTDERSAVNMPQRVPTAETTAAASPQQKPTGDPPLRTHHLNTATPPCFFNNHPEIARFSSGFLFSSLNLPLCNIFRPGPLFFVMLHGEKEISGPLKKSRALVINAPPHNNQIPSIFQRNLSRDRINNQSRNSDASPRLRCRESTSPPR